MNYNTTYTAVTFNNSNCMSVNFSYQLYILHVLRRFFYVQIRIIRLWILLLFIRILQLDIKSLDENSYCQFDKCLHRMTRRLKHLGTSADPTHSCWRLLVESDAFTYVAALAWGHVVAAAAEHTPSGQTFFLFFHLGFCSFRNWCGSPAVSDTRGTACCAEHYFILGEQGS